MNAHDRILDGLLQALRHPAPVTAGRIEEMLDLQTIGEAEAEAVSIESNNSDPAQSYLGSPVDWQTAVTVEVFARADSRTPLGGRASRALHARVYERLMAEPSLGGLAMGIDEPQLSFDNAFGGDSRAGVTTARYVVHHRTANQSLEV